MAAVLSFELPLWVFGYGVFWLLSLVIGRAWSQGAQRCFLGALEHWRHQFRVARRP